MVIASIPNLSQLPALWHRIIHHPADSNLGRFDRSGVQRTLYRSIQKWFAAANLKVQEVTPIIPKRAQSVYGVMGKLSARWLSSEFILVGVKLQADRDTRDRFRA